nr:UPF0182 family protein [Nakamurella lactea]
MRPGIGIPTMSKRAKRVLIAVVSLAVLAILWFQFVGIYVDFLWYGEVGFREVFTTQAISRILMFLIVGVLAGGLLLLAMLFAYRSRPVFVPTGDSNDPLAPYRTIISTRPRLFAIGIAAVVGIICGLSAQGQWATVQLFLNGGDFGQTDPQFGHDVGFYVFRLPMIQLVLGWAFVITALCFVAVLLVQYIYGGIRLQGAGRKVTSAATLQLSLLIGVFVLIKAVQYWFDRYSLLFSDRGGSFTGASYTDVNAVLPAKIILMVIAGICAVGFIVGAILRSVKLPAIALALLVLSSVLIGGVWPLVLQQVVVKPNGLTKEPPYITRNIEATQAAYGLTSDKVTYVDYKEKTDGDPAALAKDKETIPNARLLDPNLLSDTFTQRQQLENFYGFPDQLSVDRYTVDNKVQDYVVAAREINIDKLADNQRDWINQHMVFTHGNGFVAAPANTVIDGYPDFTVSDLSNKGDIPVDQPRIYYGELTNNYAIVGAAAGEAAQEYDTGADRYTYQGTGGVPVSNLFQRLVFATYYGEANFLFSSQINGASKVMYNREVRDRVEKAAPFLTVDTKPYPAVVDKKIVWIVDAYTTAANYPYSQQMSLAEATTNSLSARGATQAQDPTEVGYIRNSVKAVVDAYDGSVKLYQVDDNDPVLKAWSSVFPGVITPGDQITPELRSHFRYPQDLFEVQRSLLTKYHVNDGATFFRASNFWKEPDDPTEQSVTAAQPPYYLQVTLPGQTDSRFELTSALTGFERDFMAAYVTANGDPKEYGKLTVLEFPTSTQTPGPKLVQQLFNADQDIANWVATRIQGGKAKVEYGNLLTLPIDNGLLYVEPLYLRGVSTSSYPQLGQVLVWFSNRVGRGATLADALLDAAKKQKVEIQPGAGGGADPGATGSAAIVTSSGADTSSSTPTGGSTVVVLPPDEAALVAAMNAALQQLDEAKKSGDLEKIGAANKKLEQAVEAYIKVAKPAAGSSTGTSTAPGNGSTGTGSAAPTTPAGG